MRHVQIVAGVPHSSKLRRGERLATMAAPPRGVVIGTFGDNDTYDNSTDGSEHVAIFVEKRADGLLVVDLWVGQPVHERLIRYRGGEGKDVNDADQFHVVETA
jgi:hypothetical protein